MIALHFDSSTSNLLLLSINNIEKIPILLLFTRDWMDSRCDMNNSCSNVFLNLLSFQSISVSMPVMIEIDRLIRWDV